MTFILRPPAIYRVRHFLGLMGDLKTEGLLKKVQHVKPEKLDKILVSDLKFTNFTESCSLPRISACVVVEMLKYMRPLQSKCYL